MYNSGFKKEYDSVIKKYNRTNKVSSAIPLILRDMGPPSGSVFDPRVVWEKEKPLYLQRKSGQGPAASNPSTPAAREKSEKSKKSKSASKISKSEQMILNNSKRLSKKSHDKDVEKMSNNNSIESLRDIKVETSSGKLQRMLKVLDLAVAAYRSGKTSGEEELFDILWALEEMEGFADAEKELSDDKAQKKAEKKASKSSKSTNPVPRSAPLSEHAKMLKHLLDTYNYKDPLKFAKKLMSNFKNIVEFQLTQMHDRLPPLSKYNRTFKLEDWQCSVLSAIDDGVSTIVCAPTSSGKTLLSTYTCATVDASSTVLFVLPSEVLVWQVAATYYQFFEGQVTIATDSVVFQDQHGKAQVYIGTPRALEVALTKARGCAGQEMVNGEREFTILDGGFSFDYLVLDEVHTLNGPEGDALQRIIRATRCPVLALSATIGNAAQLQSWFQQVRDEHLALIQAPPSEVIMVEHFARFINLQRYVLKEGNIGGEQSYSLKKLHPVAAMTLDMLREQKDLVSALSMTPVDLMSLWQKMEKYFPGRVSSKDSPSKFFFPEKPPNNKRRITLMQTKLYETRLKALLTEFAEAEPDKYEELRSSFEPQSLRKIDSLDIADELYGVIDEMKKNDLLPAVAFQLSTFGAFKMFKTLLRSLELAQNERYPNHRADLRKRAQEKALMRKIADGKAEKANAKDDEEDAQAGFDQADISKEDIYEPHPSFVLSPAASHLKQQEIEDFCSTLEKAGEKLDINHALIRGLRRGIAIYTNEVGFTCYRRQVQILAQRGRIAVVFSDEALAYGVNMPFRSCVFCGDMGPALTPLIAQQMQGRAGRRGMDVQGNIVYLGMEWPTIENLMLGQISQVTGKNPHYPLMALQRALAASNDPNDPNFIHGREIDYSSMSQQEKSDREKWSRMSNSFENAIRITARSQNRVPTLDEAGMVHQSQPSLAQFCGQDGIADYYGVSKEILRNLGYVRVNDDDSMTLAMDHNVLSMVWELSVEFTAESVAIVACLPTLYSHFVEKNSVSAVNIRDQNAFMVCLLQIVDRVQCGEGAKSLQRHLKVEVEEGSGKVVDDVSKDLFVDIEQDLRLLRDRVGTFGVPESERSRLLLPLLGGSSDIGPPLDSGVFDIIQTKKKGFDPDITVGRRNELKSRLYRFGEILRVFNNNIQQPHGRYKELGAYSNKCFTAVRYSLMDIMTQLADQEDECED